MLTPETRRRDFPSLDGTRLPQHRRRGHPAARGRRRARAVLPRQAARHGRPRAARRRSGTRRRRSSAEFYGLTADEIGICSCSSEAYNLAALALRLKPGDEVVVNDLDFPAGATPWLQPSCPADGEGLAEPRRRAADRRPRAAARPADAARHRVAGQLLQRLHAAAAGGGRGRAEALAGAAGRGRDAGARPHPARPRRRRPDRQQHAQVDSRVARRRARRRAEGAGRGLDRAGRRLVQPGGRVRPEPVRARR